MKNPPRETIDNELEKIKEELFAEIKKTLKEGELHINKDMVGLEYSSVPLGACCYMPSFRYLENLGKIICSKCECKIDSIDDEASREIDKMASALSAARIFVRRRQYYCDDCAKMYNKKRVMFLITEYEV